MLSGIWRSATRTPSAYLALGDSYTIGTGASDESRSWPAIIAARLNAELTNPAVNGYTTLDLIRHELPLVKGLQPDLVSVLIGVNDLVQGRTPEQYRDSLRTIYEEVATLKLAAGRVAAVSIPTWSYAPAAADYGGRGISRGSTSGPQARRESGRRAGSAPISCIRATLSTPSGPTRSGPQSAKAGPPHSLGSDSSPFMGRWRAAPEGQRRRGSAGGAAPEGQRRMGSADGAAGMKPRR